MSSRHGRSIIVEDERGLRPYIIHPRRGRENYPRVSVTWTKRPSKPNGTKPATCVTLIPGMAPGLPPVRCGDKRFAAGRCVEHWKDWKNGKAARRIQGELLLAKRRAGDEAAGKIPVSPMPIVVSPRMCENAGKFRDDGQDSRRQYAAQVKRERKRAARCGVTVEFYRERKAA